METEPADVVHPEVRAHISSLVSALGGVDEDGQYQLGDDALDVLRDIKKWIRFYDQKLNRMDVARCLAETNLVGGDLLRILATWPENNSETTGPQRFKARIALAIFEILTPLTWPLERDPETTTVNHYRHLPVLQLAQVAYKRAIVNFDSAPVLHTAVRVALPALAVPLGERALRDQGIIKLVLYFLRNVAMIEDERGGGNSTDEAASVSRSTTIDAFAYQDILLLLLTLASNMGDDFRTEDTAVLEILFHLVKGVAVDRLFMDAAQRQQSQADELAGLLHQEAALLHAAQPQAPTRHSRFGTMVWVERGGGRMSTLSGQGALVGATARERQMDASKKFRPPRRGARRRKNLGTADDLARFAAPVVLHARATAQLRRFVEDFLDAGFNPLLQHVRRSIDREAPHVLGYHRSQFLYLVAWFLEAERTREKMNKNKEKDDNKDDDDKTSPFNLVAGVLNQEMFVFLARALDRAYADKDWPELTVAMRCFTQILLTVQAMADAPGDDDQDIAENILSRLFYEEATHDAVANIVKTYKDQGFDYLDACTELAHTYLRILEAYSKQNVDLQVRSRRRAKKAKAKAKKAAEGQKEGEGAAGTSEEAGEAQPNLDADADADSSDSDAATRAQQTTTERKFDFKRFATRFTAQGVVDTFVRFAAHYQDLTDAQLKRAHRFLYRIAFKQDMAVMLFRVDVLRLLHAMVRGPGAERLDRARPVFAEWEELARQVFRRCVRKIEERPVLIIEMLFSKTASTAFFLEHGYEKQTLAVAAGPPRPAATLEFRRDLDRDRQIAIAVGVLLDKNQHALLQWTKQQLVAAEAERRAWQLAEAVSAASALAAATSDAEVAPELPHSEATPFFLHPDDDTCRKAMFKNGHLRLLMRLVGFDRLVPDIDETPDAVWVVPSAVSADALKESLDLINRAEFDPPVFDNDESAEDQLRRQAPVRKKAAYDDDEGEGMGDGDDNEILFPEGGPTARRVADAEGRKKKLHHRRRRRQTESGSGSEDDGPTEQELDERARRRRQKELEKARRIKSDLYVHASDDETDDEKDAEFFAREEAIRQRMHKTVLAGAAEAAGAAAGAAKAAAGSKGKAAKAAKAKRKTLSDDDDDETEETERRKRRKSTDDDDDDDDDDVDPEDVVPARRKTTQHAGFVDSSDEEEDGEDDHDHDHMDTDTPLSSSPHPAAPEKTTAEVAPEKAAQKAAPKSDKTISDNDDDDDDDDDDIVRTSKRTRAKSGFVLDSDDE